MTIYRDALGRPEPAGTVAPVLTHGNTDWYMSKTSDAPDMRWKWGTPLDKILSDLNKHGWDTTVTYPHHGCPPHIQVVHRETLKAQEAARVTLTGTGESGYVRYGDCPKSGHSINHVTNEPEKGVSVYEAVFFMDGYQVSTPHYSTGTFESVKAQGRPVYRVWGKVVGTGSDGEPVLKVKKTKRIG